MKLKLHLTAGVALALLASAALPAEETQELAGLEEAAAAFVTAYNNADAAAIAALFTEDGEMADLTGTDLTSGRAEILARYEEVFSGEPLQIALEVDSVRLVTPDLAIEDGIFHITPADDESAPPRSTAYTAVLAKDGEGVWRIASTRSLRDVTESSGHLAKLADALKGEWTYRDAEGVRLDLAFGWDPAGKYLIGEMLTSTADSAPQEGGIRICWDAAKKQVTSWMFDAKGGFTHGVWTPTEEGWLIRSEGTTGDGESLNSCQEMSLDGKDTLIWATSKGVVGGEKVPDRTLRIVRQAPEPQEN
jgi:uncharacterized protein (TIGR02246 family)